MTTIEEGRLPASLEPGRGRCCHDRVPDRARLEALGVEADAESLFEAAEVVDAVLDRFIVPKPLKSGTSPRSVAADFSGSGVELRPLASAEEEGGVMVTGGDANWLALVVVRDRGRAVDDFGVCCLSGEMDRARSGHWSARARALAESGWLCVAERSQHSNDLRQTPESSSPL